MKMKQEHEDEYGTFQFIIFSRSYAHEDGNCQYKCNMNIKMERANIYGI